MKRAAQPAPSEIEDLLHGVAEEQVNSILDCGQRLILSPGSRFYNQGQPAGHFYVLEAGRVKIYEVTGSGRMALMRFVSPGQVFGFDALVPGHKYSTSAEAVHPSRAMAWKHEVFWQLMLDCSGLAANLVSITVRFFDELQEKHIYQLTQDVQRRLAWALNKLCQQIGGRAGDKVVIPEDSVQKDLAEMAGTTIYSVSRILSTWERMGIITKTRGEIVVQQERALKDLAENIS